MVIRVGVFGRGRLGTLVASALVAARDLECVWVLGRSQTPPEDAPVDVAVDVGHHDAVAEHLEWAERTRTDLVIGATGWPAEAMRSTTPEHGVLVAPNFSLSMALLRRFAAVLGAYAAAAPGPVDLAVVETHHRHKVDAPSGSAVLLADALAKASGRRPDDIAGASLRLAEVVGRHEVRYETPLETLTLSHEAHRREVFAEGALQAARWLHGRQGAYTLDDWAAEHLDGLFGAARDDATAQHSAQPVLA
ncbi:MAG: dihydrodipicolinate reductase C-terminal domain-containing protein [Ornithinimicrobium sp.]